jgi:hypothetical protein
MAIFPKLKEALIKCNKDMSEIIIAEDIAGNGAKRFHVDSLENLHQLYMSMQKKHWYETLQEKRQSRLFLDIESESSVVDIKGLVGFIRDNLQVFLRCKGSTTAPVFEILDSSSSAKSSFHVVCTNVFFENTYHVGAFVRRIICLMIKQGLDYSAIDESVYTKNRMFRINGSTKFGSERRLKNALPWASLLVQSRNTTGEVFSCNEIDNTTPCSTSLKTTDLFEFDKVKKMWITKQIRYAGAEDGMLTDCTLLDPIFDWLDNTFRAEIQRYNQKVTPDGIMFVSSGSRCCQIQNREHKGNHIWFRIDINRQTVFQHCFDADCKKIKIFLNENSDKMTTGCKLISVPKACWNLWNNEWIATVPLVE